MAADGLALSELVRRRTAGRVDDSTFVASVEALAAAMRTTPVQLVSRHEEARHYASLWAAGPAVFLPDPDYRPPVRDDLQVIVRPDPVDVLEVVHRPDPPSTSWLRLPPVVVAAGCGLTLLSGVSAIALR